MRKSVKTTLVFLAVVLLGLGLWFGMSYLSNKLMVDHDIYLIAKNEKLERARELYFLMIETGDLSAVKKVVEINPKMINVKHKENITPLYVAAYYGKKEIAEFLISKGADVNARETSNDVTPLCVAAEIGNKEIVELLLANDADVKVKARKNATPLHFAAVKKNKECAAIAELLISRGADINAKDTDGDTPLSWAAEVGNNKLAKFLMSKGADINIKNNNGETALDCAKKSGNKETIDILTKAAAR